MRVRFVTPFVLALALIATSQLTGAQQPSPAAKPPNFYESTYKPLPAQTTVIRNATILTAAGPRSNVDRILLQNGKIAAVGQT